MRFRRGASLDPSQVEDRRGIPGGGLAVGGGGLGLVGLAIYLLVTMLSNGGGLGPLGDLNGSTVSQGEPLSECTSGAQANTREDCAVLADVNSVQRFWETRLTGYQPAKTWTHGSASQRKHWFTVGYRSGDPRRCDTFHAQI